MRGWEGQRVPEAGAPGALLCMGVRSHVPTRQCRAGCPGLGCVPRPLPIPNSAGLPSCRAPPDPSTLLTSGCPQHGAAVALPSPQEPGAEPTCSHHQRLCYKELRAMGKEVPCTPNPTRTAGRAWSSRLHSFGRGRLGETPRGEGRGPHFVHWTSLLMAPSQRMEGTSSQGQKPKH